MFLVSSCLSFGDIFKGDTLDQAQEMSESQHPACHFSSLCLLEKGQLSPGEGGQGGGKIGNSAEVTVGDGDFVRVRVRARA